MLGAPLPTNPWCDTSTRWVTRVTGLGTYTIPKIDVLIAAPSAATRAATLAANWAAPNSATVGLNRPFAGVAGTTVTVNLIEPGTLYGDRVNQFDLRFAKILRFGRTRINVGFDLYNVTNSAPVLSYNQTFVLPSRPTRRLVAGADFGAAAAVCEVQRADRFLIVVSGFSRTVRRGVRDQCDVRTAIWTAAVGSDGLR